MNGKSQNEKEKQDLVVPSTTDEEDFILSQDLTPDYITPENQFPLKGFDFNMDLEDEDAPCPKSPVKPSTTKSKRCRTDAISGDTLSPTSYCDQPIVDLGSDFVGEEFIDKMKARNYVSHSAVALRCRVVPPPCIRNPYLKGLSEEEMDPFRSQISKCAGLFPSLTACDCGLSRYSTDFHEIEQIGRGNFSNVFKVMKRIDGCLYAVKRNTRKLCRETESHTYLLASLGFHENIVGYYSSWFENEQLFIQMELCDHSLSINNCPELLTAQHEIEVLYQVASALQYIHEKGIAHLDVKPENIYVKNGVYKLGDFGCATLLDNSLAIGEGDARYMPQEILNESYDHLDKVDIFSLGASIFELISRSRLPESGSHFFNLKEGKLPLVPGISVQFQNLIKVMIDPDPVKRPSATELVGNPIFNRVLKIAKN
ncbi:Wee1-like protein kinase, partial [Mucuna pruriens]